MKRTLMAVLVIFSLSVSADAREWTFLVFLNGNNNLDEFGYLDVNEMEQVGSSDKVAIVVQFASLKSKTTKRLYIQKDFDQETVSSPVLQDIGNVDMGDYKTLIDFVNWSAQNFPAKKYFIDVWNHGSGWRGVQPELEPTDISFDDNTGNKITTKQLGLALRETSQKLGRPFDLYGSDACLMAMIEVAAEMKGAVNQFLGSQELEPGDGWPYHLFLADLNQNPSMNAHELSQALIRRYFESYANTGSKNNLTLSSIDMASMNQTLDLFKTVSGQLRAAGRSEKSQIIKLAGKSQKFYYGDYKDVIHFLSLMEKAGLASVKTEDVSALKNALLNMVTVNKVSVPKYSNAFGLSFWFPDSNQFSSYEMKYRDTEFNRATGWADTLKALLSP